MGCFANVSLFGYLNVGESYLLQRSVSTYLNPVEPAANVSSFSIGCTSILLGRFPYLCANEVPGSYRNNFSIKSVVSTAAAAFPNGHVI